MSRQLTTLIVVTACALLAAACDNGPPLERTVARERGTLVAEFYTEDPENIQFPVKVLFAIDCSLSMLESDPIGPGSPAGRRISAVREFIDQYNTEDYPSVSFSILLWSASPLERTVNGSGNPGYTRSTEELTRVLDNARTETFTDYLGAMTNIREIVENDIMTTYYEESGANQLARSKYIVCFFSDGMPNTDAGTQAAEDIWQQVEDLTLLTEERGVGQFNFHTFFLSSLFGLSILEPDEINSLPDTLDELIDYIKNLMRNPDITNHIFKIENLVSDVMSEYIISKLKYQFHYAIKNNILDISLEIRNPTNYILQDFTFDLLWKPMKRINLTRSTDISSLQDFHEKMKRNYIGKIQTKGSITLSCRISFTNPILEGKIIKKTILLKKLIIDN